MKGESFDPGILTAGDRGIAERLLGSYDRVYWPDLTIAADGKSPYIYRWHMVPRNAVGANSYFHIQVASDPIRPLHDHPWDNQSVILAGSYWEVVPAELAQTKMRLRRVGDVIQRRAEDAHRLILPEGVPYAMTLFSTGPVRRDWGFHGPDGWLRGGDVTATEDGVSVWKGASLD